ncbi:hypothetical protein B23_2435 [Geobacillus thermoleovorans B23]|nr:hypothetical protein B23_2435 [Geobacillus thermoleovorans B23]
MPHVDLMMKPIHRFDLASDLVEKEKKISFSIL